MTALAMPIADKDAEEAESRAAHLAIEVFMETLHEELGELGARTVMEVLGRTEHVHYALVTGEVKGVIRFGIVFDDSPTAVSAVLSRMKKEG